ncbi:hypothetical protein EV363DRAFT_1323031 [Boletus edulis]|nr:hypothetical protein EV363DRAFT_1323031 [Boletus edulis]
MLSASSVSKQTEDVLEDVLGKIREEYDSPCRVLCETDRKNYVEEEESLRKQLKEAKELESNCSSWRGLLGLPSSPMSKCLRDAQELLQRVTEDINSKQRARFTGKSNLSLTSIYGQGSARAPEQDGGHPLAEGNSEPDSAILTGPLNMRCSFSEPRASEVDASFPSPSPGSPPLDPTVMPSISMITQQVNALEAKRRLKSRRNDYGINKNCMEISGSNVDGATMNNHSNKCSGAVIHTTMMPPRMHQQVPPF